MRLCKFQALAQGERFNQALRHCPSICQMVLFDRLVYAPGPAVGFGREMDRPKQETQNRTGLWCIEFRRLLPRPPTSVEDGPDVLQYIVNGVRFDADGQPTNHHWRVHPV